MRIINFCFPPLCLCCTEFAEKNSLLCKECALAFDPIKPQERCFFCFKESEKRTCKRCKKKVPMACVWDYFGPSINFTARLLKDPTPFLIKMATSYLMIQFSRIEFPNPDIITTTSSFWLSSIIKGESPSELLAKSFSKQMNIPFQKTLSPFALEPKLKDISFEDKNILFLDILLSQEKMARFHEVLADGQPKKVFALALCLNDN